MVVTSKVGQCGAFITPSPEQGSPVADGWHVVQVFTGGEQKVCDDLRDIGWHAYCPIETRWRKPRGHETPNALSRLLERRTAAVRGAEAITDAGTRERALAAAFRRFPRVSSAMGKNPEIEVRRAFIPGYVFVAASATRGIGSIKPSQHTPGIEGVARILQHSDGSWCRVPHAVIDALMAAEASGHFDGTRKSRRDITAMFTRGEPVRVVGGPFDAFVGSVVRCAPNGRIKLMLDAFGVVEVEVGQVEATG